VNRWLVTFRLKYSLTNFGSGTLRAPRHERAHAYPLKA
jgi:hypothetical protein